MDDLSTKPFLRYNEALVSDDFLKRQVADGDPLAAQELEFRNWSLSYTARFPNLQIDLLLMVLCLISALFGSAFIASLLPMAAFAPAPIVIGIWRFREERKLRVALSSRNPYRARAYSTGALYVAVSSCAHIMKIGYTSLSAKSRSDSLNQHMEGGQTDWSIVLFIPHWRAGKLEQEVQKMLKHLRIPSGSLPERRYKKSGHSPREIFSLDLPAAEAAIKSASRAIMAKYILSIPIVFLMLPTGLTLVIMLVT